MSKLDIDINDYKGYCQRNPKIAEKLEYCNYRALEHQIPGFGLILIYPRPPLPIPDNMRGEK